jgi:hypothetical protein
VPTLNIKKDNLKGAQTVGAPSQSQRAKAGLSSQRGSVKNGLTAGIGNLLSVKNFSLEKYQRQETGSRSKRVDFGHPPAKRAKSHQRSRTRCRFFSRTGRQIYENSRDQERRTNVKGRCQNRQRAEIFSLVQRERVILQGFKRVSDPRA